MTTSLIEKTQDMEFLPKTFNELREYAQILSKTNLVPKDYREKPDDILVAFMMGAEIGLLPNMAVQNTAVINGRPSLWGDLIKGMIISHPELEDMKETQTDTIATCVIKRKNIHLVTQTFSIEDAKIARLWGKPGAWTQYPRRMLQCRARGFAIRDAFPDVLKGVYISQEEAQDMPLHREIDDQAVGDEHLKTRTEFIKDKLKERERQKIELQTDVEPVTVDVEEESPSANDPPDGYVSWQALTNKLINVHNIPPAIWQPWLDKAKVATIEELGNEQAEKCVNFIWAKYQPIKNEESK